MSCSDDVTASLSLPFVSQRPPEDPRVDWQISHHEHIMTMLPLQATSEWDAQIVAAIDLPEVPVDGSSKSNDGWSDEGMIVGFDCGEISAQMKVVRGMAQSCDPPPRRRRVVSECSGWTTRKWRVRASFLLKVFSSMQYGQ